jgi:recombinase
MNFPCAVEPASASTGSLFAPFWGGAGEVVGDGSGDLIETVTGLRRHLVVDVDHPRRGAAPALPMQITRRIVTEHREGRTFQAIAEGLMADGIPTARVKTRWYAATIKAVVSSDNAAALA